jgi:hypothetical protein
MSGCQRLCNYGCFSGGVLKSTLISVLGGIGSFGFGLVGFSDGQQGFDLVGIERRARRFVDETAAFNHEARGRRRPS